MTELQIEKYARKPFYVDAVKVSEENMEAVAEWCQGTIEEKDGERYILVRVHRPLTERQTRAYADDRVLYAGTGYKVYTPKAFEKSFEKVRQLTKAQADEAGIRPPIEQPPRKKVSAVPRDPKKIKTGTLDGKVVEAFLVAEEPNPDVGVHPITVVEEKDEHIDPQIQALLDEAEFKTD